MKRVVFTIGRREQWKKGLCKMKGSNMSKEFTQEELQEIRQRAEVWAERVTMPSWKRAYLRLADAADTLDAMEARTIDRDDKDAS